MSQETMEWLHTMTRIGFVEKRGAAWHGTADMPNHYPGAVPIAAVEDLFSFEVNPHRVAYLVSCSLDDPRMTGIDETGVPYRLVISSDRIGQLRSDNDADLGVFKSGYQGHQYGEWLTENVATILDDDLQVSSAGLLKGGAVAWVQVEMPETVVTPSGEKIRPFLLAVTSFDGSVATTYKRAMTRVVCDNTMDAGLREDAPTWRTKHTKNSGLKISDAREALKIVHTMTAAFTDQVERLIAETVTEAQWERIVEALTTPKQVTGAKSQATRIANRRHDLNTLWTSDYRVAPFKGTTWGVLQAFSTWDQHFISPRGQSLAERNMGQAVMGSFVDSDVIETTRKVLAAV